VPQVRTGQVFAVAACALGALALGFLGSAWLLNPIPSGATCETTDGYAAMKAHADNNAVLALFALSSAAIGAVVCITGAVKAIGHRMEFVLGLVPLAGIGCASLILLLASGLYCQN
jgi:hypothetical protein